MNKDITKQAGSWDVYGGPKSSSPKSSAFIEGRAGMAGGRELYDKRVVPCIKCRNRKPTLLRRYEDGQNTEIFIRCACGNEGPHTKPLKNPDEHMDYTSVRAIRMWNRENIPKTPGHLDEADPRYPEHVV